MPRKPPATPIRAKRSEPMQTIACLLPGCGRGRRRRLGLPLSDAVRRTESRAAHGERRQARAGSRGSARPQKSRREQVEEHAQGNSKSASKKSHRGTPLSVRIAQAGLSWSKRHFLLISARSASRVLSLASSLVAGLLVAAWRWALPAPSACRCGCCRFSRSGAKRNSSTASPTPSTSSCAASRPACRCSTA